MIVRTKRIYEEPSASDGVRVLIDRLWPRGVSKESAAIDYWAKTVAPSHELRVWYGHDRAKWLEFRDRYWAELDANVEGIAELVSRVKGATVTLVFSSREQELNNASALQQYLERLE